MGSEILWAWDKDNEIYRKVLVDSDGKLLISDADPFEIVQDTATDLKHLPHGRVTGDGVYAPFALNAAHKLQVEIEVYPHHTKHEDGGDDEVSIAGLAGEPINLAAHKLVADAHHSEEIPDGRGKYGATTLLTIPGYSSIGMTTGTLNAGRIYYFNMYVRTPITIDQVVIEVTTAAGAGDKGRIAIYKADTDLQPTDLVIASAEFACDAIAVVTTDITETTLQEGRYLLAITFEGNTTIRLTRYGSLYMGYRTTIGTLPYAKLAYVAGVYAALPDLGTAWDTVIEGSDGDRSGVWLRVLTP